MTACGHEGNLNPVKSLWGGSYTDGKYEWNNYNVCNVLWPELVQCPNKLYLTKGAAQLRLIDQNK